MPGAPLDGRGAYRGFRANFKYDVIPIALFQAQKYVTFATDMQTWNSRLRPCWNSESRRCGCDEYDHLIIVAFQSSNFHRDRISQNTKQRFRPANGHAYTLLYYIIDGGISLQVRGR